MALQVYSLKVEHGEEHLKHTMLKEVGLHCKQAPQRRERKSNCSVTAQVAGGLEGCKHVPPLQNKKSFGKAAFSRKIHFVAHFFKSQILFFENSVINFGLA